MSPSDFPLLRYDPAGLLNCRSEASPDAFNQLASGLSDARDEVLRDIDDFRNRRFVSPEKRPLDAGFVELPEELLKQDRAAPADSELARIQATADSLAQSVDRVVVLGIGGSYMGARALLEACCHPNHNELDRVGRRNRPRMYFEGNNVDNDAVQGLLDLLAGRPNDSNAAGRADPWAIVVISKSGGTWETSVALRQFLAALRKSQGDSLSLAERLIPVTGPTGRLFNLAEALGCDPRRFTIPDGVGGRYSIFTAVGLLPAAILGLDIRGLLQGAAAMNEHFRTAPFEQNLVLRFVAACHLAEERLKANIRVLSVWAKSLEAVGLWYDQLLSESLGKNERGATPITAVNTRDLHSRGQQHQEGRRDKLITNLIVDSWRRAPLAVGSSPFNQDQLEAHADKTLPTIMTAAIQGTNKAYADDRRPTADLHLPRVDEPSLGQLFQMLMLATFVEGRLIGINPFGQPGVQKYKQNMDEILGAGGPPK